MSQPLHVLFVVNECNPEWSSVPGVAYHLYAALRERAEVTLVTHGRNREALSRATDTRTIIFVDESAAATQYYHAVSRLVMRGRARWNLLHLLSYPVYAEFDARTYERHGGAVARQAYDIVHAFTPVLPRYPYRIAQACGETPFVLGPVNGGLPYPSAFREIARAEADRFNRLRGLARFLPGYTKTYARADKILCGSRTTQRALQTQWHTKREAFDLFFENGVGQEFFVPPHRAAADPLRLLFVGRLVPCKGVDMLLRAFQQLDAKQAGRFQLTIVGDGEERHTLETLARELQVAADVRFVGWVNPRETAHYYHDADLFCFPSVREFGGAVVLEAMAAGLPCLVADYGGPAEYVTPQTGFTLSVASPMQLVSELVQRIEQLAKDAPLRLKMSEAAVKRAAEFTWARKAERLEQMYRETIAARQAKA